MRHTKNKFIQVVLSNKKHIDSSLFLLFINVSNFVFPLLLSPIIISRCGVEGFGIVTLFQSIMMFVSSLTDYGFNINGTREVTINQNDNRFVNQHFFLITHSKTILLIAALFFYVALFVFFPKAKEHTLIYFSSIAILIGRAYNPMWVLRAIHKMKFMFYFYVFFKIVSILIVYFFLKSNDNLFIVNLIIGLSDVFTCFFATLLLFINMKWRYFLPSLPSIKHQIFSGFGIFIQTASLNANAYLNPMILGSFVDSYSLGIYCVVEKIILVIKFAASFLQQSAFPKACELSIENKLTFNKFMKSLQVFLIVIMIITSLGLTFFSDLIVSYFIKENRLECRNFLIFNAWIPLVVSINMVPFLTFMVYQKPKPVTCVIVISVIMNLIFNSILSKNFGIYGISTGIYITELFISISLWVVMVLKYPKINFLNNEE
jgi:O-antigen/teichoic acid export membrane protein